MDRNLIPSLSLERVLSKELFIQAPICVKIGLYFTSANWKYDSIDKLAN